MAGKGDIVEQALKLIMGGGDDAAKKAFANTCLKTPQGNPMRLYHMTPEDILEFRASPENRSGPAVFLSPYPDFQPAHHQSAERGPAGELTNKFKEGANVMPVYADVRNPLILDHPRKIKEAAAKYQDSDPNFPRIISPEARAAMEAEGYDGIVFGGDNPIPYGDRPMDARLGHQEARDEEFLVFDPKRVKSAVSNTGGYDFANPDITKSGGGQVREGYAGKGRVVKNIVEGIGEALTGGGPNRVFPELAERYPELAPPVKVFDKKTGKEYLAKDLSEEALAVQKAREVIQKDIDVGNYKPFFDVKARADVDPFNYPSTGKTIDVKPVKPETQAKYRAMAFDPEGLARLREGYATGLEQKDVAENWYFVKQLEDKFVEEYGPEEGRRLFKERFAKPMALTTGGADPTSNLLMSYYGNYLREKGLPIPEAAYDMPYPIGGRYASSNMGMFGRNMEKELTPDNPKRLNFQNNFLGYKEPTIDEQMSKGFDPKLQMPEWYGPYEEAINMLAREYNVDPRYFQEVAWAGLKSKGKGGYQGMPMIQHVNEAIERTSRLTGVPPEEVVRRGLVRAEMPIYGMAAPAGALAVGAMGDEAEDDIDNAVRIAKGGGGGFTKLVRSLLGLSEKEGLEALTKAGSGYKGVPGKPDVVKLPGIGEVEAKPLPPLERAAETYMERLGRPGEHRIDVFQPLDEEFARRVAGAYGEMKHAPTDPEVKRAYDALAQETLDQLEAAKQAGIDFSFIRGEDPYRASPGMGYADLAERGHLYVFPTDQGFGSDVAFDPANNPLLKRIGPLGDLENATVNDAFRIVHDLYGHYGPGNPFFRAPGEERAFKLHSRMYSPEARPAMASETRGQNSWLNFGPYGSYNRGANAAETIYADQKTGIMPPWTYEKADGGAVDDALRIAKDVGGSTPVLMEDAKGNKYDAQGNIIPPTNPGPNPARMSDPTLERAGMMDIGEPENYETEVKPFIEAATTPMNYALESPAGYSDLPVSTGTVQTAEPTLLETMKIATQLAVSGQPSDERGASNWGRSRQEAIRSLVGAPEGGATSAYRGPFTYNPSDTANYLNTLIDFSPYAFVEMAHDIPYEGVKTGDYGTAATEGALNAVLTAPGLAALGAAGRAGYNALKRSPKLAAGLAGVGSYFMPDEAEAGPERWFSKLFRAAEALPMEKMTGEQALAMLRRTAPQEEIKWTGLEGFASENPMTTKQALLDFIKRNQVQTQDVVLGGGKPISRDFVKPTDTASAPYMADWNKLAAQSRDLDIRYAEAIDKGNNEIAEKINNKALSTMVQMDDLRKKMVDATIEEMGGLGRAPKYQSYSTPGGEGYRETLVTLPVQDIYTPYVEQLRKDAYQIAYKDAIDGGLPEDRAAKLADDMTSKSQPHELARLVNKTKELNEITLRQKALDKSVYKSPHWDEKNVIGHIRSQMLTANPPGANRPLKLFNVDENQSDLAQAGRKSGFKDTSRDWKASYRELVAKNVNDWVEMKAENAFARQPDLYDNNIDVAREAARTIAKTLNAKKVSDELGRGAEYDEMFSKMNSYNEAMPAAPYVTSTQGWTDFSIKKALDQAIDSGADYFTFTPGEVQAARYDLSKHISKVQYNPDDGSLIAYDPKGKMVVNESVNDPSDLDEYLGKELAEKMRLEADSRRSAIDEYEIGKDEDTGEWAAYLYGEPIGETFPSKGHVRDYLNEMMANELANSPAELSGLDLKVGGEGMIDYYNNIYKKRVEKVVKDLTGKKVQWEVLPAETSEGIVPRLGFRIDDDIKNAKFPTFASGGIVNKALELTRDY